QQGGGTFYEQMAILNAGGSVAVDHKLASYEITNLIATGKDRVTVICKGFAGYEVNSFLSQGARIWVDKSFAASEITSFCSQAHGRVSVSADGFASYELNSFAALGAQIQYASPEKLDAKLMNFTTIHGQ